MAPGLAAPGSQGLRLAAAAPGSFTVASPAGECAGLAAAAHTWSQAALTAGLVSGFHRFVAA